MKKLLVILFGLLALASCTTDGDEPQDNPKPNPMPVSGETLYMATTAFSGYPEMIYSIYGDLIYQCEDAACRIRSLVAEGSDWYAVILKGDGIYQVVKNGESIHMTGERIWCFTVEDGIVYTVQENQLSQTVWVCRDFERLYEVVGNVFYDSFSVDEGNVAMAVYGDPDYWYNGQFIPIEGLDAGFSQVYGIDKKGDDMLITYKDINTGKNMYWWNGDTTSMPAYFTPTASCIAKGHSFIMGKIMRNLVVMGGKRSHALPAVLMDGYENILSTSTIDFAATQLVEHNGTTYILVKSVRGATSYVFAWFQLLNLPDIVIPDDLKPVYQYLPDGKMNLTELGITAIAVVTNQK